MHDNDYHVLHDYLNNDSETFMIAKKKTLVSKFIVISYKFIFFLFKVRSPALRVQSPVF